MNIQTLILAILNSKEASGYEIKKLSSEGSFSFFIEVSYGSIYPALARLERDGLVQGRSEAQTGKPDRRIYSITPAGRQELMIGLRQPIQDDVYKSEFLLVAMNAELAGGAALARGIDARIAHIETKLKIIGEKLQDCDNLAVGWVGRCGLHALGAQLSYLKENKDALLALAKPDHAGSEAAE